VHFNHYDLSPVHSQIFNILYVYLCMDLNDCVYRNICGLLPISENFILLGIHVLLIVS
jgi:hypothetical protein